MFEILSVTGSTPLRSVPFGRRFAAFLRTQANIPYRTKRSARGELMPGLLDRAPDAFARCRHIELCDSSRLERVHDRDHDCRQRADRTCLARALRAERIGRSRDRVAL